MKTKHLLMCTCQEKIAPKAKIWQYEEQIMVQKDGKSEHKHSSAWTACDGVGRHKVNTKDGKEHHHFKCILQYFQERPSFDIPDAEKDCDNLISYQVYKGVKT